MKLFALVVIVMAFAQSIWAECATLGERCQGEPCCPALFCDINSYPPTCKECLSLGSKCAATPNRCCGAPDVKCEPAGSPDAVCTATSAPICGASSTSETFWLAALAAIATAIIVALGYMAGEAIQNPRLTTWAKTEAAQIFTSLIIVGVVFGTIQLFCTLQIGEIASIFTRLPKIYEPYQTKSIYDGSIIYLEKLMDVAHSNLRTLRYLAGAYEIRTTYTKMVCTGSCFISLAGYNEATHGGETLNLAIVNNLANTATISYLTAAFEYFVLQYILNGLFLVFLPIAIVLRSLPFMRQFAGALVAICISLYIMYPTMLVINASIAPGMANTQSPISFNACGCKGAEIFSYKDLPSNVMCAPSQACYNEESLVSGHRIGFGLGGLTADLPFVPASLDMVIRANGLIFITVVFFAAVNFIVIAAVARGVAHLLGEEVDISKLGQMI
ncbi:MAG: hypothetical protein QXN37_01650 [Candidatus Anstonellaceae archaeon]